MKRTLGHAVGALLAAVAVAAEATPAKAAFVVYTFEPPQFLVGQATPLLNRAPNVGSPTFLTSFTSTPTAVGFSVLAPGPFTPFFSGQSLIDTLVPADDLILTFNMPVDSVTVIFVTNSPVGAPGRLELTTPVGGTSVTGGNVGVPGGFAGGTLTFASATPFTAATLRAFNAANVRVQFAADNLTLNTAEAIPEPASLALLGVGGLCLLGRAGWRNRRAAGGG